VSGNRRLSTVEERALDKEGLRHARDREPSGAIGVLTSLSVECEASEVYEAVRDLQEHLLEVENTSYAVVH
jgi:hypothetical protein